MSITPEDWARKVLFTPSGAGRSYLLEIEGVRIATGLALGELGAPPDDPDPGRIRRTAAELLAAVYASQSDTRHRPVIAALLREIAALLEDKAIERVPWGPRSTGFKQARRVMAEDIREHGGSLLFDLDDEVAYSAQPTSSSLPGLPVGASSSSDDEDWPSPPATSVGATRSATKGRAGGKKRRKR